MGWPIDGWQDVLDASVRRFAASLIFGLCRQREKKEGGGTCIMLSKMEVQTEMSVRDELSDVTSRSKSPIDDRRHGKEH